MNPLPTPTPTGLDIKSEPVRAMLRALGYDPDRVLAFRLECPEGGVLTSTITRPATPPQAGTVEQADRVLAVFKKNMLYTPSDRQPVDPRLVEALKSQVMGQGGG